MTAGERLQNIRLENNYKHQPDFAKILKVKGTKVKDMEINRVKIPLEIAELIEDLFNINLRWLLTGRGEKYLSKQKSVNIVSEPNTEYQLTIPGQIDFNLSQKEIEILKSYRDLNENYQTKYYGEIIGAAADQRIEDEKECKRTEKDARSAV